MKQTILIIEDEPQLVGILEYLLRDEGYSVETAYNGEDALKLMKKVRPDLVILDIMLPKMDGFEVCNRIRKYTTIPVIILSAKDQDEDIIKGLEIGADDYITKPFNHRELILRIAKILKRINAYRVKENIKIGDLQINLSSRSLKIKGNKINLTPTEFNLLTCLAKHKDRVLSWESLLKEVWGYSDDWDGGKELIKVNIRRLRKKIEPAVSNPVYLVNLWGMGYRLASP